MFDVDFEVLSEIEAPSSNSSLLRVYSRNPIAARDSRQIMYDLKRRPFGNPDDLKLSPEDLSDYTSLKSIDQQRLRDTLRSQNGMVVEYNSLVSTLLDCNNNVSVLGSDAQAKAALSYMIKYVTKPPAELAHSLSLLYRSRRDIQIRSSVSEDSGTTQRIAMHNYNRTLNKLNSAVEILATMAAAAILGIPAETCTQSFWIAYVSAAIQYV